MSVYLEKYTYAHLCIYALCKYLLYNLIILVCVPHVK